MQCAPVDYNNHRPHHGSGIDQAACPLIMSSFFGLAEQALSAASGGGRSSAPQNDSYNADGPGYGNAPRYGQQPRGSYDTDAVLSHADDGNEENRGYVRNAIQHVHDNPDQHQEQVSEGDLSKYGPVIFKALSSVSSKSGLDIGSLVSGGLGEGGGNQLLGHVIKEASGTFGSGGGGGQDKQGFVNGAALTLTKLVAQKQLSAFTGGSNSGGLGALEIGKSFLQSRFG